MTGIRRLITRNTDFEAAFAALFEIDFDDTSAVNQTAREIIGRVRREGDTALLDYTARFDRWQPRDAAALAIDPAVFAAAWDGLDLVTRNALQTAAERIETYHRAQLAPDWSFVDAEGNHIDGDMSGFETAYDRLTSRVEASTFVHAASCLPSCSSRTVRAPSVCARFFIAAR